MAGYNDGGYGNDQSYGFGFPTSTVSGHSFWHNASASWADKRVGCFFSRHRAEPKEVDPNGGAQGFMDSEVMIG
jgi:hypothetical protein